MLACFQVCLKAARATVFPDGRAFQRHVARPFQPSDLPSWSSLRVRSTVHASPVSRVLGDMVLSMTQTASENNSLTRTTVRIGGHTGFDNANRGRQLQARRC